MTHCKLSLLLVAVLIAPLSQTSIAGPVIPETIKLVVALARVYGRKGAGSLLSMRSNYCLSEAQPTIAAGHL
jgi:hypothetical protein